MLNGKVFVWELQPRKISQFVNNQNTEEKLFCFFNWLPVFFLVFHVLSSAIYLAHVFIGCHPFLDDVEYFSVFICIFVKF